MSEPEIGSYRDADGTRRKLVVRQTANGDWHVLDVDLTSDTAHVVDALAGDHDGRPPAGDRPRLPDHRRRSNDRRGTGGRRAHT